MLKKLELLFEWPDYLDQDNHALIQKIQLALKMEEWTEPIEVMIAELINAREKSSVDHEGEEK